MFTDEQKQKIIEQANKERAEYVRLCIEGGKTVEEVRADYVAHKEFFDSCFRSTAELVLGYS